jgi:hypothetical protein
MKKIFICLSSLFVSMAVFCQSEVKKMPYLRQGGMYYSSDYITSDGFGMGAGIALQKGKHLLTEVDMNIFWLNGNAFSARISAGYQKKGLWAPAFLVNITTIFGSHTEVLPEDGSSPRFPVSALGIRLAPLRFENEKGFVSAIEFGYAVGKDKAKVSELTLLAVGVCF